MFRDPRAFVASFQNADPEVINKVIEMVNGLIDVGLAEKQKAIDDHAAAVIVAADALNALDAAEVDLVFKLGELHIAKDDAAEGEITNNLKADEEADALSALNAANTALSKKQTFLASEILRIDGEKAVLEKVVTILEGLQEQGTGRRLLSIPPAVLATLAKQGLEVDPDALNAVLDSVNNLINEGEALRNAATDDVSDATEFQASKDSEYQVAIAAHAASKGVLDDLLDDVAMYQDEVNAAQDVHDQATATKIAADESEASLNEFRESEVERVDSETADFKEVIRLLEDM